jgi:prolyl-tRNA synthetase
MVIKPYGYSLWNNIKNELDKHIVESGHENAYFPLFIPKSFLEKEAKHVEGFAKECAVVTHSRLYVDGESLEVDPASKLEEEVIVRPTSETVIWSMFKKWINSYRDLPIKINQWANVVRWEMRTRLFLRTSEFLWQEGHTAHASKEEAMQEALDIVQIYQNLFENFLSIPVTVGRKSESERFAGAEETFTIEAMMRDKKALQAGTSHYLGTNFGEAFGVKFQNQDNKEEPVYATSWGVSTRMVGALIMAHGDEIGLRLPPRVAPIQVVIVPIYPKIGSDTLEKYVKEIEDQLTQMCLRVKIDVSENSPGFKFNHWEIRGVPIRIEVGIKEAEGNSITLCRRDTLEKTTISFSEIGSVAEMLNNIQEKPFFLKTPRKLTHMLILRMWSITMGDL